MRNEDLGSLGTALTYFRLRVTGMAQDVETGAAVDAGANREVEAEGWTPPAWGEGWRANMRLLGAGEPVLRRIVSGWTAPTLEDVLQVDVDENALGAARLAFVVAAAAVAVEVAVHGRPYPRDLEDRTHFRRTEPGHMPEQAEALMGAAREALTVYACRWLAAAGRVEGSFLPRVA